MNLKQKLSRKLKKTGGFTLIEMLIVVAIIAILIAVSIPLVSGALDKARKATDAANERAAKAAAVIAYMTEEKIGDVAFAIDTTYYYDAVNGNLVKTAPANGYGQCSNHKGKSIAVSIGSNGDVKLGWGTTPDNTGLDSTGLMTTTASADDDT
ncbi:prepilin-type N-terminal cleavage/methylation domain-containing protein [uncultured Intestinimonas sp.]|uniref:prepilin-type N-terminal cleavage/methylation domain-containing protein n=1 Tax=uncultured Intestinimonas sp. TaxID=1689265 RepID=UPI0025FB9CBD|nr:prepilin-type N-terminal cleavage/methylation domain-containing protein [uncultured Intestinimonas sp.]